MRLLLLALVSSTPFLWAQSPAHDLKNRIDFYSTESLKLATEDRAKQKEKTPKEIETLIQSWDAKKKELAPKVIAGDAVAQEEAKKILKEIDTYLLNNPLIKNKNVLAVKRAFDKNARQVMGGSLGVGPSNFQNNSELWNPKEGWNNEFVQLIINDKGEITEKIIHTPEKGRILTDPEVHPDGDRIMYSTIGTNDRWHLFELNTSTGETKQLTPEEYKDFDSFAGTYTPDGKYIFCSTGTFLGLPCTHGGNKMCGLFSYDPKTNKTRQLTFDQDSNWDPVIMNDGKVLYQRWEYADLPHSNSRFLFTMNPDGTTQQIYYGSGSYFPTSFFNARPIPGHPTAVAGVATGHHSVARSGRLLIIDPKKGLVEEEGIVTEIPFHGRKVEPIVRDRLPDDVWPHFLQPLPLNEKYFIVAMKNDPHALWGLYLVDVFDNRTLIAEGENLAYLEPGLLAKTKPQPTIPQRINLESDTATIFMQNVYEGEGLKGVPKGSVKKLRIGTYSFSPWGQGGLYGSIGMDGPWDMKLIMGTVDVEADGSAMFTVPANTPIFLQPLDAEGKALQLMRTWFTAMPGEKLSCVGCHEDKSILPVPQPCIAATKEPQKIQEWYGKARGFSFVHEVQPVLDKYCIECHNDKNKHVANLDGKKLIEGWQPQISGSVWNGTGGKFSESYTFLQRYVRRPGIESDMRMLSPLDVHADQTELIQMLKKGHYDVQLDQEAWDKLTCWIDFNAPFYGARHQLADYNASKGSIDLKEKYREMFGAPKRDLEYLPEIPQNIQTVQRVAKSMQPDVNEVEGWPIKYPENQAGKEKKIIPLGNGLQIELVKIPAGSFIMGSPHKPDSRPLNPVKVEKPFWMATLEITNAQFRTFNPEHDSRDEHRPNYQFGRKGFDLNKPFMPAVRISWEEAMAFCNWLSKKSGLKVSLPTEAQWEWACRAGSNTDFSFGNLGFDFTPFGNMGDIRVKEYVQDTSYRGYESVKVVEQPAPHIDRVPHDTVFDDGLFLPITGGYYKPNAWGLYDMHGNVAEWTLSEYRPYPYIAQDGRNNTKATHSTDRVARGGSWFERPFRCTSGFRTPYRDYQKVFNVGFRIVINE